MTLRDLISKAFSQIRGKGGDEVYVCCPFCIELVGKTDYKFRLGLNLANGKGHCYRCEKKHGQQGGKAYWFREICRVFGLHYSLDVEENDPPATSLVVAKDDKPKKISLPEEYEPLWKDVNEFIGKQALAYLKKRRVTDLQIDHWGIGFCAVGRYAYRIIFPVKSPRNVLVGFVARDFSGHSEVKYLNSEGCKTFYGMPFHRQKKIVLVEGIFDKLSFDRARIQDVTCVACLGKTLTAKQIKKLRCFDEVLIWPDPDLPGIEGCISRAQAVLKHTEASVSVVLPDSDIECDTDLGDMLPIEIKQRYSEAVPYSTSVAQKMILWASHSSRPRRQKQSRKLVFSSV